MDLRTQKFDQAQGMTRELYLCSPGKKVIIREINGEDEDTLTLVKDQETGEAVAKFVASVIVSESLTYQEIQSWRARDKYLILFEVVRLTYGDNFKFEFTFEDGGKYEFQQSLPEFTWDFSDKGRETFPERWAKGFNPERIKPYLDNNTKVEWELTSKRKVGFEYLTGELESAALMIDPKQRSLNDELRDRNFYEIRDGAEYPIENFRVFNAREMMEIRSKIDVVDPAWPVLIELEHPKTGRKEKVSIFSIPDFFVRRLL